MAIFVKNLHNIVKKMNNFVKLSTQVVVMKTAKDYNLSIFKHEII